MTAAASPYRTLLLLAIVRLRNRVRREARRLRDPRHAAAALIGVVVLGALFRVDGGTAPLPADAAAVVLPLLLLAFLLWSWLWGGQSRALALSPAETQMLLPAPVPRRAILAYRLASLAPAACASAAVFTLLARGGGVPWPLRWSAYALLLGTLMLHQIGASLVHAGIVRHGRAALRRVAVPLIGITLAAAAVVAPLAAAPAALQAPDAVAAVVAALSDAADAWPARWVLLPVRAVLAPVLAPDVRTLLQAAPAAAGIALLHIVWVVRLKTTLDAAAWEATTRRARRPGRSTEVRRRTLPLPARGPAATAIVWKNVLQLLRRLRPAALFAAVALGCLLLVVIVAAGGGAEGRAAAVALLAGAALLVPLAGPLGVRSDLRTDVGRLALLRTWPLSGRAVATAEVAASTLVLTAVQLGLAAAAVAFAMAADEPALAGRAPWAGPAVLVLAGINTVAVAAHNYLAVLLPAWFAPDATRQAGGVAFVGWNALTAIAAGLLTGLALLPAAGLAVAGHGLLGPAAGAAGAIAGLAVACTALVVGIGRRLDVSEP